MAEKTKETKNTKDTKETKKCKKGLIIGCVVAAIVVIAAIIALVVINPFKKVNMVGKYELSGLVSDGEDQSDSLALLKAFGMSYELEITDDKNGKITVLGHDVDFTYDGKQFHFDSSIFDDEDDEDDGDSTEVVKKDADYTFKDDKITIKSEDDEMVFSKKND